MVDCRVKGDNCHKIIVNKPKRVFFCEENFIC